ncbi:MAG TPA: hypothetical protein VGR73_21810 [Bryobacteraceae bacterium]|nr:hypothetical protein [Bryobacteraceae bacterium]
MSDNASHGAVSGLVPLAVLVAMAHPCLGALAIERAAVHQFDDGPVLDAAHIFLPGETVYFSCRLTGYQTAASADDQHTVKLSWRLHISDPAGVAVVPDPGGRIQAPVFAQDKDWRPKFIYSFGLPPFAPSGTYRIEVQVRDEVSNSQVDGELNILVHGHDVEPGAALAVRNLHFLRAETDATALDPAIYRPGETLWARFDINGYKYGPKNRYSVEYGLAILRENGARVFEQPAAAEDTHESFYPQSYVPGSISLNLDPMVPQGAYTLVITVRDKIGEQSAEARAPFQIGR